DRSVLGNLDIVESRGFLDTERTPGRSRLHIKGPDHGNRRIVWAGAAVAIGKVEHTVSDVAAQGLVQYKRRRHVVALVSRILHADPSRRVDGAIVIQKRNPGVVGPNV